ncbi:nucleotidyltransferase family protein [Pseudoalteromonas maricaloris]|uniref:nucleotidyltransferase family protein n=1 Tax=Pseudoalteromonas maricaloris TaxID=184924 RepID=UPI003C25D7DA
MYNFEQVIDCIQKDQTIRYAVGLVAKLELNDWYISAGFVRNFIWDIYFGEKTHQVVSDIDVIYFDKENTCEEVDRVYESQLTKLEPKYKWSVKNQARMHKRNGDLSYESSLDAMSYWPEIQTAIGVCLNEHGEISVSSPFLDSYQIDRVTRNSKKDNLTIFNERVRKRFWLKRWPQLKVDSRLQS